MSSLRTPANAWFLSNLLAPIWRRTVADARAAPARAWRRWALALLGGYVCACGTALTAVVLARRWIGHGGLQAWDEHALRALADSPFTFPTAIWFEAWGSSAFLVPLVTVAIVLFAQAGRTFRALTLLVAYLSVKGLVLGSWQLWNRDRPDLVADGIAAPGLHSFPSGHAVNSLVVFGLLGVWWWQASRSRAERTLAVAGLSAAVLLTCAGRVRLGSHWPSDIVAGLIIGGVWLAALVWATTLAERS